MQSIVYVLEKLESGRLLSDEKQRTIGVGMQMRECTSLEELQVGFGDFKGIKGCEKGKG